MSTTIADGTDAAPGTSDVELVERIASAQDADALSELYDRFSGVLLAVIRRVVGSAGDAEEVLQEVFIQAWKQASRYDRSRSSVSNWLSLIARSRSIDRLRKMQVKSRTAKAAFLENPRVDTSPEGARNVFTWERRRRLREALSDLPEEQRRVIELSFFRGLTQAEISELTDTPLGTVKTRTLLAMKKLRKALADDLKDLL